MTFILIAALKASIVLLAAFLANMLLRKQSAALRHTVLAAALFAAAVAPALTSLAPSINVMVGSRWMLDLLSAEKPAPPVAAKFPAPVDIPGGDDSSAVVSSSPETPELVGMPDDGSSGEAGMESPASPPATVSTEPAQVDRDYVAETPQSGAPASTTAYSVSTWRSMAMDSGRIFAAVWFLGLALLIAQMSAGVARLVWIERRSTLLPTGPWTEMTAEAVAYYGLRRPIRLLQTCDSSILATWGARRPTMLLPAGAASWPEERIRVAVYHELAHVQRGDWVVQIVAELARAAYWFNPLFWMACSRLVQESEQACDDAAIGRGIRESDYAAELLALTRTLSAPRRIAPAAQSMARPSTLERRFKAMLNPRLNRSAASRFSVIAAAVAFLAIALPIAAFRLVPLPAPVAALIAAVAPAASVTVAPEPSPAVATAQAPAAVPAVAATESAHGACQNPKQESPFSRRARLEPKFSGPVTIDTIRNSREAFETLGSVAGIQVIFHRQFVAAPLPPDFALKVEDVCDALDTLARQTRNFWEVYDGKTILVATDNPTVRREMEPKALKAIYLNASAQAPKAAEIAEQLRTLLGSVELPLSTAGNVVLLRAALDKTMLAEQAIAALGGPANTLISKETGDNGNILTDVAGNSFVLDAGRLRKVIPASHDRLQPKVTGLVSVRTQSGSREAFETLAERAGIQVVFHRQFANQPAFTFAVDNVDIFTALDLLSFQTGNFWQVSDPHSIIVATDNPTVRRDVEPLTLKAFHLANSVKPEEIAARGAALQTLLTIKQIAMSSRVNALMLRETADKVALAERIMAAIDKPAAGAPPATNQSQSGAAFPSGVFAQPVDLDVTRTKRSQLQVKSTAPVSIRMKEMSRYTFEALAGIAGVHVIFHRQFANQAAFAFVADNIDIFAALDRLCFETGNFWLVSDPHTIIVATDNPTVRRDVEPLIVKTFYPKNVVSREEFSEIIAVLKAMFAFNQNGISTQTGALVLRDTAEKIGLAEKMIAILDAPAPGVLLAPPVPASPAVSSGVFSTPIDRDARRARLQAQLQPQSQAPLSLQLNQRSAEAFKTLAEAAGLRVEFHRQFSNQAAFTFEVDNFDGIAALERLALLTGNFWQVIDEKTILVATDNPTVRREVETTVLRTIELRNINTLEGVNEVIAALRALLREVKGVEPGLSNSIVISGTVDQIAVAEKIVADLDIPGRTPLR